MTPEHQSPTEKNREATAPYNFVELPEKPVASPLSTVDHSRYKPDLLTGQIECTFETKSPLYTRGLMSPDFFALNGDKAFHELTPAQREERAQFYQQHSKPIVPGSSLRGMVRQLVEIISFGKFLDVTNEQLVFRAVAEGKKSTALGAHYSELAKNGMAFKAQAGYMKKDGNGDWSIQPAIEINGVTFARFKNTNFGTEKKWKECKNAEEIWFIPRDVPNHKNMLVDDVSPTKKDGYQHGVRVWSGPMSGKKHDYIVFDENPKATLISISDNLLLSYREQVTDGQHQLLKTSDEHRNGVLLENQPVFYLCDDKKNLMFFGHLPLMRLPYKHTPVGLVPEALRGASPIDIAENLFGFVRGQNTVAGRVFFSDALLANEQTDVWYSEKPVVPQILSGPKPTSFQLCLTQSKPDDKTALNHYDSPQTTLRGYKMYWHRGASPDFEGQVNIEKREMQNEQGRREKDTQHTLIRPVKSDVKFTFTIRFENLHAVELGALLWALQPPPLHKNRTICHKLGMGKPLGLGSIQICDGDVKVKIDDRSKRYQNLFDEQGWAEPTQSNEDYLGKFKSYFESYMEQKLENGCKFRENYRIQSLLYIMTWEGPNSNETKYQSLKEFKERKILPSPEKIDVNGVTPDNKPHRKDCKNTIKTDNSSQLAVQANIIPVELKTYTGILIKNDKSKHPPICRVKYNDEFGKEKVVGVTVKFTGNEPGLNKPVIISMENGVVRSIKKA
ncbi:MAG TPA: TIGR03986 family CRISPR-associated RAMP protein [Anaerolineales bacterium]|nr:TIGR03986 family CRISPR-associated RAMP protein [Anaerolineales bacterium]